MTIIRKGMKSFASLFGPACRVWTTHKLVAGKYICQDCKYPIKGMR